MEEKKAKGIGLTTNRFLTFYLEEEIYGVNIFDVKEIIAMMKTTPVPKTPKLALRLNIELHLRYQYWYNH